MGEMISMIAHQWRQPLSSIAAISMGLNIKIQLDEFDIKQEKGLQEFKEYFNERFNNIDALVQSLTTTIDDFRRLYKPNKKTDFILISEPIKKAFLIIRAYLKRDNIEIIENYICNKKATILSNEIIQVVLNILKNSQDNFQEKDINNPKISITCKNDNDKTILKICDNGGEIPEDVLPKIFDLYFSTKTEKNGTGLGLYMSKIIVEKHHNGKLNVINKDDGVCFIIELGII